MTTTEGDDFMNEEDLLDDESTDDPTNNTSNVTPPSNHSPRLETSSTTIEMNNQPPPSNTEYFISFWFVNEPFSLLSMNNGYSTSYLKDDPSSGNLLINRDKSGSPDTYVPEDLSSGSIDEDEEERNVPPHTKFETYNVIHIFIQNQSREYTYHFSWHMSKYPIITYGTPTLNFLKSLNGKPCYSNFARKITATKAQEIMAFCNIHKNTTNNYFLQLYASSKWLQRAITWIDRNFCQCHTGHNSPKGPTYDVVDSTTSHEILARLPQFYKPPKWLHSLLPPPELATAVEGGYVRSYPGHLFTHLLYLTEQITEEEYNEVCTWGIGSINDIFATLHSPHV